MAVASDYSSYAASQNGVWSYRESYRWIDFDADASAQVDRCLTDQWTGTKQKSFSFALTEGAYFKQQQNQGAYTCYVELNFSRNKISKIYQKNKNTGYQREMRRNPAFVLPSGDKKKLSKLFDRSYADEDDPDIMSEPGMLKFFKDCGVNAESHETLIVSYLLKCPEMGILGRDEFVEGFFAQGCTDKADMKKAVQAKCRSVNGDVRAWKAFYRWVFVHVREDEKKKTIPTGLAMQLWQILFRRERARLKLLDAWLGYCAEEEEGELKSVSRDLWEQIYDFLKETQTVDDYDDAGGSWPVAVDEFVEYLQEKQGK